MSKLIDPEGLARQRPQRLLDFLRSLTMGEAVSSGVAFCVTRAIFALPGIGIPLGVIANFLSFIASLAAAWIRHLYNANERLTTHIEKLRLEKADVADAARRASEEEAAAKRQLADAQNQLRAVQTYLDMQDLSDTTQLLDGVSHEVVQLARRDAVQTGKILHALTTNGVVYGVPAQPEMETERFPLVSIPPFGRGFSRHGGLSIRWGFGKSAKDDFRARLDRLDEPARLSLGMVASPQSPLPFHLAKPL